MTENRPMLFRVFAVLAVCSLPAAAQEELGDPFTSKEHEYTFQPPKGWTSSVRASSTIFSAGKESRREMEVIRLPVQNPTTPTQFTDQLRKHMEKYKSKEFLFTRQATIGGRTAWQIAARVELETQNKDKVLIYRTVIHRTHLDYYVLDCRADASDSDRALKIFDASIATFRIEPTALSTEEKAAEARTIAALQDGVLGAKDLQCEAWQGVFLQQVKVGYKTQKLTSATVEGAPGIAFESDTVFDLKKGGNTKYSVRGSFTVDGRYQKMAGEQTVTPEGGKEMKFRHTIVLKDGKVTVRRHMDGADEETSFTVPEGTLLIEVADVFRRAVSLRPKNTYFVRTLDAFESETRTESLEVTGPQTVDDSRTVLVTFSSVNRGLTDTYWFDESGKLALLRGNAARLFQVVGMTREEALK